MSTSVTRRIAADVRLACCSHSAAFGLARVLATSTTFALGPRCASAPKVGGSRPIRAARRRRDERGLRDVRSPRRSRWRRRVAQAPTLTRSARCVRKRRGGRAPDRGRSAFCVADVRAFRREVPAAAFALARVKSGAHARPAAHGQVRARVANGRRVPNPPATDRGRQIVIPRARATTDRHSGTCRPTGTRASTTVPALTGRACR
jgi:hypothetical protein